MRHGIHVDANTKKVYATALDGKDSKALRLDWERLKGAVSEFGDAKSLV